MKKFKATLEQEVTVTFTNPEGVISEFIDSNWRETFYTLDDLEEVVDHLTYAFVRTPDNWVGKTGKFVKFIEGFGEFESDGNSYVCRFVHAGDIRIEETEALYVSNVDEEN